MYLGSACLDVSTSVRLQLGIVAICSDANEAKVPVGPAHSRFSPSLSSCIQEMMPCAVQGILSI